MTASDDDIPLLLADQIDLWRWAMDVWLEMTEAVQSGELDAEVPAEFAKLLRPHLDRERRPPASAWRVFDRTVTFQADPSVQAWIQVVASGGNATLWTRRPLPFAPAPTAPTPGTPSFAMFYAFAVYRAAAGLWRPGKGDGRSNQLEDATYAAAIESIARCYKLGRARVSKARRGGRFVADDALRLELRELVELSPDWGFTLQALALLDVASERNVKRVLSKLVEMSVDPGALRSQGPVKAALEIAAEGIGKSVSTLKRHWRAGRDQIELVWRSDEG